MTAQISKPQISPAPAPGGKDTAAAASRPVPPPVRATYRRPRHVLLLASFLLGVGLPVVVAAAYLWIFAADQYASNLGFSVRQEEQNSALELLSGLSSISGSSSSDTDILYEYLQSQRLVADIDQELNLRAIWTRPENDPVFTLDPEAKIEDLLAYWQSMVRLSQGAGSGLLEVEVRAFTPEDATLIAETLFRKSSEKLNELSSIAREDTIRYARDDLAEAQERLSEAREALTRFRNVNQIVDPALDLQGQAGLLSNLQTSLAEAIIEYDLLTERLPADDSRVQQAELRLRVIEARIAVERRKMGMAGGQSSGPGFADVVGEFEKLAVEREFAQKAYLSALANYDTALAESRRQNRYLAAYMLPTQAERATYPERLTLLALIGMFLFLVWAVAVLVAYSIKDRR